MERQKSLKKLWTRLLLIFVILLGISPLAFVMESGFKISLLIFIFGNMGAYIGIHKGLGELKDDELHELSESWIGIIIPSFVGGLLALILYFLFLSGLVEGDLFPEFILDESKPMELNIDSIHQQYGKDGFRDYAKLLFWSFFAGFNQKYVVNLIDSFKSK